MPGAFSNRIAVVLTAAVIGGGAATAVAVAFPGRAIAPPIAAPEAGIVATPAPSVAPPSAPPTPSPAPAAAASEPIVRSPSSQSSGTTTRAVPPPARQGGGGPPADCSSMPGPACKAVTNQPGTGSPESPRTPQPPE